MLFSKSKKENLMLNELKEFFSSDVLRKLAKYQTEEQAKQKEIERHIMIKERYDYFKYKVDNEFKLTDEQSKEWDYVKFFIEIKNK